MAYNTKNLLQDATGHFIPQFYDAPSDQFLPLGYVYDVVLQNTASTTGNGTPLTVGNIKTVTVEITGSASTQTTVFEGSSTSGTFYPIQGIRLTDFSMANQSTALNELWQFDVTGLVSFRARIASLIGIYEVSTLSITSAPTASGFVTINLNGITTNVTVATTDAASDVATKIRNTSFSGWTTGGTGTTVTFTSTTDGVKIDATYTPNSTGATGTISTTTQGASPSLSIKGKGVW